VPADIDLMAMVRHNVDPPPVSGTARVWVADGRAQGLRRLARMIGRRTHGGRPGDEMELDLRSVETVARWLAGHGPDVAVLGPETLAEAVRSNWAASAAAHASDDATGHPTLVADVGGPVGRLRRPDRAGTWL
jgi:proteasome accessory factor B